MTYAIILTCKVITNIKVKMSGSSSNFRALNRIEVVIKSDIKSKTVFWSLKILISVPEKQTLKSCFQILSLVKNGFVELAPVD